jgi:hypothetical protein
MKTAWLRKDLPRGSNEERHDVQAYVYELSEPLYGHAYPFYALMKPVGQAHLEGAELDGHKACGCELLDGYRAVVATNVLYDSSSSGPWIKALLAHHGYELQDGPPPSLLQSISPLWEEVFS